MLNIFLEYEAEIPPFLKLTVHSNSSNSVFPQMLRNFKNKSWGSIGNVQGIENFRKALLELYIYDGTDNSNNLTFVAGCGCSIISVIYINDKWIIMMLTYKN